MSATKETAVSKKTAPKTPAKAAKGSAKTAKAAANTKKIKAAVPPEKKAAKKPAPKKPSPRVDATEATLREMAPQASARESLVQVEAQKYGSEATQHPETYKRGPLPAAREIDRSYGDTNLVLLVRDPEWIFAYWEIGPDARNAFGMPKDGHDKTMLLRWYDVTGLREFTGSNANNIMDIQINDFSMSWYQKMPSSNRAWCADIGILDEKGRFRPICRSKIVQTPRNTVAAPGKEEEWGRADEIRLQQIFVASGGTQLPSALSSAGLLASVGLVSSERLVR